MKRKSVYLAFALGAVVIIGAIILTTPGPELARPMTVSFLGFSNALPFEGAPEPVRSRHAVFQVTNHTARTMAYHSEVYCLPVGFQGSSMTMVSNELPGHGAGTFKVPAANGTNECTFHLVSYSSRPRPAWQLFVRKVSKRLGTTPIFLGPAKTYPQFTNTWTTPQS